MSKILLASGLIDQGQSFAANVWHRTSAIIAIACYEPQQACCGKTFGLDDCRAQHAKPSVISVSVSRWSHAWSVKLIDLLYTS